MSDLIVIEDTCRGCGLELQESDNFCSVCGLPVLNSDGAEPATDLIRQPPQLRVPAAPQVEVSFVAGALNNRAIVVAILLCAGPVGLPALWFSPRFSRLSKIITTTVYFLVTAVLPLLATWYFLEVTLRPLADAFQQ